MSITLTNTLTNKRWVYETPPTLVYEGLAPQDLGILSPDEPGSKTIDTHARPVTMTFAGLNRGDYVLINETPNTISVVIWGRTYVVQPNTIWQFMVHDNLASIARVAIGAPPPGKLLASSLTLGRAASEPQPTTTAAAGTTTTGTTTTSTSSSTSTPTPTPTPPPS